MTRTLWLSLAVVFAFLFHSPLWAQTILTNPWSPQANGRAGIYTSSTTDDPLVSLTNPALLGFQADRNRFMLGFFPQRTRWGFRADNQSVRYSARALQVGLDRAMLGKFFKVETPFSVGIGYQEVCLDYGDWSQFDENGHAQGMFHLYERSQGINLAAAGHWHYLQAGLGVNLRYTHLLDKDHAYSNDFGLYIQSPLETLLFRDKPSDAQSLHVRPFCTVAASYTLMNVGPRYTHGTEHAIRLPRIAQLGWNVSTGLKAALPDQASIQLLSLEVGVTAEEGLLDYETNNYKGLLGNIHPVSSLILGRGNSHIALRKGFEIGLLEILYSRIGHVSGMMARAGDDHYDTEGFGFHLTGVFKLMTLNPDVRQSKTLNFMVRHLDLQYDWSQRNDGGASALDGESFQQLTLLWKY